MGITSMVHVGRTIRLGGNQPFLPNISAIFSQKMTRTSPWTALHRRWCRLRESPQMRWSLLPWVNDRNKGVGYSPLYLVCLEQSWMWFPLNICGLKHGKPLKPPSLSHGLSHANICQFSDWCGHPLFRPWGWLKNHGETLEIHPDSSSPHQQDWGSEDGWFQHVWILSLFSFFTSGRSEKDDAMRFVVTISEFRRTTLLLPVPGFKSYPLVN